MNDDTLRRAILGRIMTALLVGVSVWQWDTVKTLHFVWLIGGMLAALVCEFVNIKTRAGSVIMLIYSMSFGGALLVMVATPSIAMDAISYMMGIGLTASVAMWAEVVLKKRSKPPLLCVGNVA